MGLPLLHAGQAQKEIAHNEALVLIDMLVQAGVESADLSTPPVSPAIGQCWIVGPGATGAWAGRTGAVAGWTAGGWRFAIPRPGTRVWVADRGHAMIHDGSGWSDDSSRMEGYYVAGNRIIGARQTAIATPSGGSTTDAEARGIGGAARTRPYRTVRNRV
jgi:hypothetical protein